RFLLSASFIFQLARGCPAFLSYTTLFRSTVCPAQAAGVKEIAVVMPPTPFGGFNQDLLATCHELGVTEVYRIGGAQAVAALAYGVDGIAAVDMVVGPGNLFVTLAKRFVFGHVAIDMLAGPTEVVVLADESAPPDYVADSSARDRKSTRLNSSHQIISYAVFCL